jgi:hypothetical protein
MLTIINMSTSPIFPIISDTFDVIGICTIGIYTQKWITAGLQELLYGKVLLQNCLKLEVHLFL